jgi:hypothetical protein
MGASSALKAYYRTPYPMVVVTASSATTTFPRGR